MLPEDDLHNIEHEIRALVDGLSKAPKILP